MNFPCQRCVGFDASHSAHVPDTGVIIYKALTELHVADAMKYVRGGGGVLCSIFFTE